MKRLLFSLLLCAPFLAAAQVIDTAAIEKQVDSLIQVSRTLTGQQDFDKAIEINAAAESIALKNLGRESAAYGSCCFNHGRVLHFKRDYGEAEKWYLESKAIRGIVLGNEHPNYANSLNNLAILYHNMGKDDIAEPLYLQVININAKVFGKEHLEYAQSVNNLAVFYFDIYKNEEAEPLFLEAKVIFGKVPGKEYPEYVSSLDNLGLLYLKMYNYEKAEQVYQEALAIHAKKPGKIHSEYAERLSNLAVLYQKISNYEKAEPLYLEALTYFGEKHSKYAANLNNLADLYRDMGNYDKAESLHLNALAIRAFKPGKEHPDYAQSLNNLAVLYYAMGENEKAEQLFLEVLTIRAKVHGKEHPDYAESLNNLAGLYLQMGNYKRAEPLFLQAETIFGKVPGKEILNYAGSMNNLAVVYWKMGKNKKAESRYLKAKAIFEKVLGKEHQSYLENLYNLVVLYFDMDNYNMSLAYLTEGAEIEKKLLVKASRHLSEREMVSYIKTFVKGLNRDFSFSQMQKGMSTTCYDNTLFYKGFLLNAAQQVSRVAQTDSMSTDMFHRLKAYNRQLAIEYAKPLADHNGVAAMEEKANSLEKELTRSVAGLGEALRQVNWQEVQASLKPNEAAIEFVHYQFFDPDETDSTMYAALVLRPDNVQPQFIPLFEEKQLQELLSGKNQTENISLAYGSRGLTPGKANNLQGLYELCWQAMEAHLKGVNKVYYAPSGLLHRINFNAIPINKEENLSDRFELVRLSSTRSLVVPDLTKNNADNEAMLYGGIHYELDTRSLASDSIESELFTTKSGELSFTYSDRSLPQRGDNWNYLKGTQQEVTSIDSLLRISNFSSVLFSAESATEESFKTIGNEKASPRILHLATHGYFFPDITRRSPGEGESQTLISEPIFKISDHPMIRSGLILSGGNHAWKTGKPLRPDMEDGILTAYEISQMDLSHTELVVLSACETGLGDIEGNEGVYGLQRAFKIAGAKYLIMSLWQVPDHQTQELMTTFYSKWVIEKMSIPDAFRQSQKEMQKKHGDPYLWAGFVLVE